MNPGILRSQIPGLGYTGIPQWPGYYITITFWWWPGSSWWFPPSLLSSLVASFCLGGWWWTGSVKYWRWGSWRWCCWWWWQWWWWQLIFIDVDNDLHNHGELVFLILLLILWKKGTSPSIAAELHWNLEETRVQQNCPPPYSQFRSTTNITDTTTAALHWPNSTPAGTSTRSENWQCQKSRKLCGIHSVDSATREF